MVIYNYQKYSVLISYISKTGAFIVDDRILRIYNDSKGNTTYLTYFLNVFFFLILSVTKVTKKEAKSDKNVRCFLLMLQLTSRKT